MNKIKITENELNEIKFWVFDQYDAFRTSRHDIAGHSFRNLNSNEWIQLSGSDLESILLVAYALDLKFEDLIAKFTDEWETYHCHWDYYYANQMFKVVLTLTDDEYKEFKRLAEETEIEVIEE